jgi:hypothetical protein
MLMRGIFCLGKDEEPRKTSDPSVKYDTRAGGRRKSRQGSGSRPVTDRGELAFRSVSREHERTLLLVLFVCLYTCLCVLLWTFSAPQCTRARIFGFRETNANVCARATGRQSQRNALAPLNQTEATRRRAASAVADDGLDERVGGPIETDSTTPVARERKLSLKDKIKARFAKV